MFFATGNDEVRWTLAGVTNVGPHDDGLRLRLGQWLASRQGADVLGDLHQGLELVDSPEVEARLLRTFVSTPTPGDTAIPVTAATVAALADRRDGKRVRAKLDRMREARDLVTATCPALGDVLETVIHRIFIAELDKEVGGSSTTSVGVIWANPTPAATAWDLAEFLVHELTHQVLFLDEQVHGHYTDRAASESGSNGFLPRSTIRRARRPLGPVFHSLAVALELIAFRERAGERYVPALHPKTETLLGACQATIESIVWERDWQAHFRSRGLFLFERYRDLWDRLVAHHPGVLPGLLRLD